MSTRNMRSFQNIKPKIADSAWIDESAVVIGDVTIGEDSSIWPTTVVRGDVNNIIIGSRTNVQDGCVLHVTHIGKRSDGASLTIGDDVTVGHKVILHACTIGNRCLIGMGAIVMDNAVVEDEVIVGAGALVPEGKKLESGYLYLGSPAKRVRKLSTEECDYFTYTADNYVKLAKLHQQ